MSTTSRALDFKVGPLKQFRAQILTRRAQYSLDLSVLVSAFIFAYFVRFDFSIPEKEIRPLFTQLPYVILLQFSALLLARVHKFIWRYVGLAEVKKFVAVALWSALPLVLLRALLPDSLSLLRVPYSIIFIDTCVGFGGALALRMIRRELCERKRRRPTGAQNVRHKPILLIGAGRAGVLTAVEICGRGDVELEVKGFIDDDVSKRGSVIHGIKILGTTEDLPRLVRELGIDHVVISIAQATRQEFRRILDICEQVPVKVRVIPALNEILEGRVKLSRIREVQIEDLLGRAPISLDEESIHGFLTGKTLMVTGAGGSIGSELVRQVARYKPGALLLVERSEFALFNIEREVRARWPQLNVLPLIADVGEEGRMRSIFSAHHPHVIFHAAAHKHVPMMETNVSEAIKNNVLATSLLGNLAGEYGAEAFVLISTDKAVRPTSVMGASKRVAELVVQDLQHRYGTRYVAVRFGNVIGSAGSVIPIFREQIMKGGPVTVTHPDMVRYFMTIPEAAQLVLQAGAIGGKGGILILDMGEPVRILDLAMETIRLSGLKPFEDIDIVFSGVRAGEKLYEELQTSGEELTKTIHPKIFSGKIASYPREGMRQALQHLTMLSMNGGDSAIRRLLNELLPEARISVKNDKPAALSGSPVPIHPQRALTHSLGS